MIIVTGAKGFLGGHLLAALAQRKAKVRALYRGEAPPGSPGGSSVEWVCCDLLDVVGLEQAMSGATRVFHCAATVSFDPAKQKQLQSDNTAITANVVNAALQAGVKRFVHVSSVAAIGRGQRPEEGDRRTPVIDEESPWTDSKENSAYARSKYLAELEVWRGIAEGLPAAIVSPSVILGEGDWNRGSARLMQIVDSEFPWYTDGVTGWVDVKDVVAAMLVLMDSEICGERFILNAGNLPYRSVFSKMALALNRRPPHKFARRWMTALVWRLELLKSRLAGREATVTRETARTAQSKYGYSGEKWLTTFPDFQYRDLDDTIRRMAEAYRNHRSGGNT